MKIYFAGSIRGGRDLQPVYMQLIEYLRRYGEVLTEHVGSSKVTKDGEGPIEDFVIYQRDVAWLKQSDVVVAEVSIPSLGVGYEIGVAQGLGKRILCLYRIGSEKSLSPMISGDSILVVKKYQNIEEAMTQIDEFFR